MAPPPSGAAAAAQPLSADKGGDGKDAQKVSAKLPAPEATASAPKAGPATAAASTVTPAAAPVPAPAAASTPAPKTEDKGAKAVPDKAGKADPAKGASLEAGVGRDGAAGAKAEVTPSAATGAPAPIAAAAKSKAAVTLDSDDDDDPPPPTKVKGPPAGATTGATTAPPKTADNKGKVEDKGKAGAAASSAPASKTVAAKQRDDDDDDDDPPPPPKGKAGPKGTDDATKPTGKGVATAPPQPAADKAPTAVAKGKPVGPHVATVDDDDEDDDSPPARPKGAVKPGVAKGDGATAAKPSEKGKASGEGSSAGGKRAVKPGDDDDEDDDDPPPPTKVKGPPAGATTGATPAPPKTVSSAKDEDKGKAGAAASSAPASKTVAAKQRDDDDDDDGPSKPVAKGAVAAKVEPKAAPPSLSGEAARVAREKDAEIAALKAQLAKAQGMALARAKYGAAAAADDGYDTLDDGSPPAKVKTAIAARLDALTPKRKPLSAEQEAAQAAEEAAADAAAAAERRDYDAAKTKAAKAAKAAARSLDMATGTATPMAPTATAAIVAVVDAPAATAQVITAPTADPSGPPPSVLGRVGGAIVGAAAALGTVLTPGAPPVTSIAPVGPVAPAPVVVAVLPTPVTTTATTGPGMTGGAAQAVAATPAPVVTTPVVSIPPPVVSPAPVPVTAPLVPTPPPAAAPIAMPAAAVVPPVVAAATPGPLPPTPSPTVVPGVAAPVPSGLLGAIGGAITGVWSAASAVATAAPPPPPPTATRVGKPPYPTSLDAVTFTLTLSRRTPTGEDDPTLFAEMAAHPNARARLLAHVRATVASAAGGLPPTCVKVMDLSPGSLVATIHVVQDIVSATGTHPGGVRELAAVLGDPARVAALFAGDPVLTGYTVAVTAVTVTTTAVPASAATPAARRAAADERGVPGALPPTARDLAFADAPTAPAGSATTAARGLSLAGRHSAYHNYAGGAGGPGGVDLPIVLAYEHLRTLAGMQQRVQDTLARSQGIFERSALSIEAAFAGRAFAAWRSVVRERYRREILVQRAARRSTGRGLGRCFISWVAQAYRGRPGRESRLLKGAIVARAGKLHRTWVAWRSEAHASKKEALSAAHRTKAEAAKAEEARAAAAAKAARDAQAAAKAAADAAAAHADRIAKLSVKAMRHWIKGMIGEAFNSWLAAWQHGKAMKAKELKAIAFWTKQKYGRPFNSWLEFWADRKAQKAKIKMCLGRMLKRAMVQTWTAWRDLYYDIADRRRYLRDVVLPRMMKATLARAWTSWFDIAIRARFLKRFGARLAKRNMARAYRNWLQYVELVKDEANGGLLSTVVDQIARLKEENERLKRDNERFVRLIDSGDWARGRVEELSAAGAVMASEREALMALIKQLGREHEAMAEALDKRRGAGAFGGSAANERLMHGNYVQRNKMTVKGGSAYNGLVRALTADALQASTARGAPPPSALFAVDRLSLSKVSVFPDGELAIEAVATAGQPFAHGAGHSGRPPHVAPSAADPVESLAATTAQSARSRRPSSSHAAGRYPASLPPPAYYGPQPPHMTVGPRAVGGTLGADGGHVITAALENMTSAEAAQFLAATAAWRSGGATVPVVTTTPARPVSTVQESLLADLSALAGPQLDRFLATASGGGPPPVRPAWPPGAPTTTPDVRRPPLPR